MSRRRRVSQPVRRFVTNVTETRPFALLRDKQGTEGDREDQGKDRRANDDDYEQAEAFVCRDSLYRMSNINPP